MFGRPPRKKVVVAIPAMDMVHTSFAASLANMLMHTVSCDLANSMNCSVQFWGGSMLPHSRQILAQYLLDTDFTHILYIDSDMRFPYDMLAHLMSRDEPIIGINAMTRRAPFRCTAQKDPGVALRTDPDSTGLERVCRTGFAVMWIAAEVFRKVPEPWFEYEWLEEWKIFKGEDYYFCEKARAAGYEILIDHDLSKRVEHIGQFGYSPLLQDVFAKRPEAENGSGAAHARPVGV